MGYVSKSPAQPKKNISLQLLDLGDLRPASDKGKLGAMYNSYGMSVSDVLEPQNMFSEIQRGFTLELERAGYSVLSAGGQEMTLKADVMAASCDMTGNSQKGITRMRIVLTDKGQEVLNNVYSGEGNVGFTLDGTCSDALNKSIQNLIGEFVKDLDQYVAS